MTNADAEIKPFTCPAVHFLQHILANLSDVPKRAPSLLHQRHFYHKKERRVFASRAYNFLCQRNVKMPSLLAMEVILPRGRKEQHRLNL
jgi:hypothetical protein